MGLDVMQIRQDFAALKQLPNGKSLVYLDSAATALKPKSVVERLHQFYSFETANVHRGGHFLGDRATSEFEKTRSKVASFINASSKDEIIFTKGTTEAINLVAQTLKPTLHSGDEILITEAEHHANIVPWYMICKEVGCKLVVANFTLEGELDWQDFSNKLNSKTKIVALTHCSNVLGSIVDVEKAVRLARKTSTKVLIDGAQAVACLPIDVQKIDCDFYVFSAHKAFGPYGVGILYGKQAILDSMPPYQGGGAMISTVEFDNITYNDVPFRFEAGTPNISGVIATHEALCYIENLGFENILHHEQALTRKATVELKKISGLRVIGEAKNKAGVLSFTIDGMNHSDIAQILDQQGVAVRAGHHCAQPLLRKYNLTGTVRASFSVFNTEQEVDYLIQSLHKAMELLK